MTLPSTPRQEMPVATLIALIGLASCFVLSAAGFVPGVVATVSKESAQTHVIALVLGLGFTAVPSAISAWALRTGRIWAPIAVTVTVLWIAILLLNSSSLLSWLSLGVGILTIVSSWLPSARRYGRNVRSSRSSGIV